MHRFLLDLPDDEDDDADDSCNCPASFNPCELSMVTFLVPVEVVMDAN